VKISINPYARVEHVAHTCVEFLAEAMRGLHGLVCLNGMFAVLETEIVERVPVKRTAEQQYSSLVVVVAVVVAVVVVVVLVVVVVHVLHVWTRMAQSRGAHNARKKEPMHRKHLCFGA